MQSFSLANSLIKKLYSSEEDGGPNIPTESRQRVNSSTTRTTINDSNMSSSRDKEDRLLIVENVEDNAVADDKVDGNDFKDNDDEKIDA